MRNWIVAAITAIVGISVGWLLRGPANTKVLVPKTYGPDPRLAVKEPIAPPFPDLPKPTIEPPKPIFDEAEPTGTISTPPVIVGEFSPLPATGPVGALTPLAPGEIPISTESTLKADEALARQIVLKSGGEIVSSSDAGDAAGKIGRNLVAESSGDRLDKLKANLRKALGNRVVLSDGGSTIGSSTELRKLEEKLEAAREKRDQARIDFLPQAPALRQIEEEFATVEKEVADFRKLTSKARLNILVRPVMES